LITVIDKAAREVNETGLVRDAQQGSWHIGESPVSSLRTPGGPGAERERPRRRGLFFGPLFCSTTRLRVTARRKKNDAHHRQGQVVQQRQGLRVHRAR